MSCNLYSPQIMIGEVKRSALLPDSTRGNIKYRICCTKYKVSFLLLGVFIKKFGNGYNL